MASGEGWGEQLQGRGPRGGGLFPPPHPTSARPQTPHVCAQGLPGGCTGSGLVRGVAGGNQGGGGAGLLAAGRLTPRGGAHGCPSGAAPTTTLAFRASTGAGAGTSWTQRRPRPLPRTPRPCPASCRCCLNKPGNLLPVWPVSHRGPLSFSLSERPKRVRLLRRTHLSGPQVPHGGGAGTYRGKAMQILAL